jgi:hypothetical protein
VGWVIVINLDLDGEGSLSAACANGKSKQQQFPKNETLGLTGNRKGGARGDEAGESVKGGPSCALLGGVAVTGETPVYGLPDAHISRIRFGGLDLPA